MESMMREILGVSDEPGAHRRWFHDDYFDLFVWQAGGGEVVQFQLCYGIDSSERALVWHKRGGFFLDGIETGKSGKVDVLDAKPAAASAQLDPLVERFDAAARALPEDIRLAMTARVREFAEKKDSTPARRKRFRRASWQRV
jgi:hypothetical protein